MRRVALSWARRRQSSRVMSRGTLFEGPAPHRSKQPAASRLRPPAAARRRTRPASLRGSPNHLSALGGCSATAATALATLEKPCLSSSSTKESTSARFILYGVCAGPGNVPSFTCGGHGARASARPRQGRCEISADHFDKCTTPARTGCARARPQTRRGGPPPMAEGAGGGLRRHGRELRSFEVRCSDPQKVCSRCLGSPASPSDSPTCPPDPPPSARLAHQQPRRLPDPPPGPPPTSRSGGGHAPPGRSPPAPAR